MSGPRSASTSSVTAPTASANRRRGLGQHLIEQGLIVGVRLVFDRQRLRVVRPACLNGRLPLRDICLQLTPKGRSVARTPRPAGSCRSRDPSAGAGNAVAGRGWWSPARPRRQHGKDNGYSGRCVDGCGNPIIAGSAWPSSTTTTRSASRTAELSISGGRRGPADVVNMPHRRVRLADSWFDHPAQKVNSPPNRIPGPVDGVHRRAGGRLITQCAAQHHHRRVPAPA